MMRRAADRAPAIFLEPHVRSSVSQIEPCSGTTRRMGPGNNNNNKNEKKIKTEQKKKIKPGHGRGLQDCTGTEAKT
jgi:hypothetical protein